jgi:hypothetical protein
MLGLVLLKNLEVIIDSAAFYFIIYEDDEGLPPTERTGFTLGSPRLTRLPASEAVPSFLSTPDNGVYPCYRRVGTFNSLEGTFRATRLRLRL